MTFGRPSGIGRAAFFAAFFFPADFLADAVFFVVLRAAFFFEAFLADFFAAVFLTAGFFVETFLPARFAVFFRVAFFAAVFFLAAFFPAFFFAMTRLLDAISRRAESAYTISSITLPWTSVSLSFRPR